MDQSKRDRTMKKTVGTLQELVEEVTEQIKKMTPEEKLETKNAILQSVDKRQEEMDAKHSAAPHPNEYTPLHADLATYFSEFIGSTPYRKLEERLLLRVKEKEGAGVPLNAEEQGLLNRIKFCCKCGTKNPKDSAHCFNCGQKLVPTVLR
jgi:ribosomal protein L40E